MTETRENIRAGSSPLARGTQINISRRTGASGLIPARAGNTSQPRRTTQKTRAHPRSRGEHRDSRYRAAQQKGSSPLARGTLTRQGREPRCIGLIPARAGNTPVLGLRWHGLRAHPRSRGEHIDLPPGQYTARGSSPLARGTPNRTIDGIDTIGLIPARAGNTGCFSAHHTMTWAHPRSRGEHTC